MLPVSEADLAAGDPAAAVEIVMAHLWKRYGEGVPPAGARWMADRELPAEFDDGFTVGFASESAENWQVTVTYVLDTTGKALMRVSVSSEITVFRWEGEVDVSGEVSELVAPPGPQAAACWYGRIREMPADSSYDDCLVLPPEGAGAPMIGLVGADQGIENEIADLRTSGAYVHFFGTLEWDPTNCGGYRLVVSVLWPEGSGE